LLATPFLKGNDKYFLFFRRKEKNTIYDLHLIAFLKKSNVFIIELVKKIKYNYFYE